MDVKELFFEICPTMANSTGTQDVSDHTIKKLTSKVQTLREVKIQRMQKVSISISLLLYFIL